MEPMKVYDLDLYIIGAASDDGFSCWPTDLIPRIYTGYDAAWSALRRLCIHLEDRYDGVVWGRMHRIT